MPGILLDTHALYWLVSFEAELGEEALAEIGKNQKSGTLFASPITAWELSIASRKPRLTGRPHLGAVPPDRWFRDALRVTAARIIQYASVFRSRPRALSQTRVIGILATAS